MDVSLIAHPRQYGIKGQTTLSTACNIAKIGYIFASRHWQLSNKAEGLEKWGHRAIAAIHFIPVLNYISSFIEYVVMNKGFGEYLSTGVVKNPIFKGGKLYFRDGNIKDVKYPNLFNISQLKSEDTALHRSALYANLTQDSKTYENAYKYLLDRNANILSMDFNYNTVLHRAAATPSLDLSFFELVARDTLKAQKRADPSLRFLKFNANIEGQTALDLLFKKANDRQQMEQLIACLNQLAKDKVIAGKETDTDALSQVQS